MSDYKLSYLMITIVTISMLITGTTVFMADVVSEYSIAGAEDYSSISKLNRMSNDTAGMSGLLQNTTADPSIIDYARSWATGGWAALQIVFNAGDITTTMASETVESLPIEVQGGLTSWFLPGILTIVSLIIIFAILAIIFRTNT